MWQGMDQKEAPYFWHMSFYSNPGPCLLLDTITFIHFLLYNTAAFIHWCPIEECTVISRRVHIVNTGCNPTFFPTNPYIYSSVTRSVYGEQEERERGILPHPTELD